MRVSPAGEKTLGERDEAGIDRRRFVGLENDGLAEGILDADASRAREDEALLEGTVFPERVVAGVLREDTAEVGFGTEEAGGHAGVERVVGPLGGLQRIIATIADDRDRGYADAGGLGKDRDQV